MRSGWMLPLSLLAAPLSLPAAEPAALMRQGRDALAAGVWEVASRHFGECLASRALKPADKPEVAIRLAEVWIRDGRAADALDLLNQSFVSNHPETPFWEGQALITLGRLAEGLAKFLPLLANPESPHRAEAAFTAANLELALGRSEAALAVLATAARDLPAPQNRQARLHQAEILVDLGRPADARSVLPPSGQAGPADEALRSLLDGRLLLAEGHANEAVARLQSLIDAPEGQSLRTHHLAAAALAEALIARGSPDDAVSFLLGFIQQHPDSPQLDSLFATLSALLPKEPAANDPVLERISQWITPPEMPATGLLATENGGAIAAWPSTAESRPPEILGHALYATAVGLIRAATPVAMAEARQRLTRLRWEFPGHPLADRALFLLARLAIERGDGELGFGLLDSLRDSSATADALRGRAAFTEAGVASQRGDRRRAADLFEQAAAMLADGDSRAARINAAVLRLIENPGAITIQQVREINDPPVAAELELERALAQTDAPARRAAIEQFLSRHGDHPRAAEARVAAAEAALAGPQPDLSFARAQLDTIATDATASAAIPPARIAFLKLRITDLSRDPAATIAAARAVLETHGADSAAPEAMLVLGRNLFETRSYNDARLVLEKLAASDTDPGRAQAAWLLAARSAALVPTTQSQQEALILFDKAIDAQGPVSPLARLEKARLLIDMSRLDDAKSFLLKWFSQLEPNDPLHLPAGLLLAEAIRGGASPAALTEALEVYDKLLAQAGDQPAVFNRIQYLRGLTLEQIPDAKDPSGRRLRQAFTAYYSVLETPDPPAEWHYFELCGFKALKLLSDAGRWPAAVACARKIASFNGPRAREAADLASQLQLKHMIWED